MKELACKIKTHWFISYILIYILLGFILDPYYVGTVSVLIVGLTYILTGCTQKNIIYDSI